MPNTYLIQKHLFFTKCAIFQKTLFKPAVESKVETWLTMSVSMSTTILYHG